MKLATAFGASARSSAMVIVPPDVSIRAVSSAPAATAYIATATNAAAPQKRRMCPHISRPDCHHHHQNTWQTKLSSRACKKRHDDRLARGRPVLTHTLARAAAEAEVCASRVQR